MDSTLPGTGQAGACLRAFALTILYIWTSLSPDIHAVYSLTTSVFSPPVKNMALITLWAVINVDTGRVI